MDIPQPGADCLVGIGVGRLPALNEVGGIKNGLKVGIVDALQQIDAASNGITIDVFLILVEQDHGRSARSCGHFTQPSQHLVAILGWIDGTAVACRGRIEGEDTNIGRLQGFATVMARSKRCRCSLNELSMGTFPMGEPMAATPMPCASSVSLTLVTC